MRKSSMIGVVLAVGSVAAAGVALAFTIETHFTKRCHETLAAESLRNARALLQMPAPPPTTRDEQALIGDLQFAPDDDMRDLAGATLLIAVRDNDLKGASQDDLTILSSIHGDPATQMEHCLRGPDQKEPGGSAAAVAACRAFIRQRALEALDGLDATGRPDITNLTSLNLHLSLRGSIHAWLPTYYVRIGQAMHAIQDSFTHTYRTPDGTKITVALNWLDSVNRTLDESIDGPAHATSLDVCDDPDDLRRTRRRLAVDASTALLVATADPTKTRDERMAAVDQMLDTYLSYSPGCTFDNGWCNAAEAQYKDKAARTIFGCATAGTGTMVGWGSLALLALTSRRRWRRAGASAAKALVVAAVFSFAGAANGQTDASKPAPKPIEPTATSTTTTTPAKAATSTTSATPAIVTTTSTTTGPVEGNPHAPPAPTIVAVAEPGPHDPSQTAWGAYLGSSGSVDKMAAAVQLGGRLKVSKHWTFGLDGEWNPWITLNPHYRLGNGVFNLYETTILRFPLAYENFNLRGTLSFGVSYLLMDLYGAPSGSVGLYGAVAPAGLEWKLSRSFLLVINPLSIALPVPQMRGIPLTYPQYRFNIGVEIYRG
jgi:uncharacterized protein (TIGR03382 family)